MNAQLTHNDIKDITKATPYYHSGPNRKERRVIKNTTHRNEVRQVVPVFEGDPPNRIKVGEEIIFHTKKSNLPRLYHGMSRIKNRAKK